MMIRLLFVTVLWLFPALTSAQTIAEMSDGTFVVCSPDEICLTGLRDDPPGSRIGIKRLDESWGRGLGKISFDLVHTNNSREEMVLIQGKETEDGSGVKTRGGEFYLGLKKPHTSSSDDAMFDALIATYNNGFQFRLPVYAPNLSGGSAVSNHLVSGSYQLHLQGDGNFVIYELIGETWCARWAISWLQHNGTGFIDPNVEGLPAVCR